jgi:superoxide dismutase, Fe-Mn family
MFELPKLNYAYDALEPYMDAETVEIHYSKHHQGYTDKFNAAIAEFPEIEALPLEDIFKKLNTFEIPEASRKAIQNNGGGYINHKLFWESIGPEKEIDEQLVSDIKETFGSVDKFKEEFTKAATTQFGSGWAWLVRDESNNLKVYSLPNQESPLTLGHTPIFNLDVWEHAYYLKYQNRRPEFIENWWKILKFI